MPAVPIVTRYSPGTWPQQRNRNSYLKNEKSEELSLPFTLSLSGHRDRDSRKSSSQKYPEYGTFIPIIVGPQCAAVTNFPHSNSRLTSMSEQSDGTETAKRPRWKDHEDVIDFILKRTIPDYPVPRGATKDLYHSVAKEVKETFNLRGLIDYTGVKYVTEKYGTDPAFGNRKMLVIHPAKTSKARADTPRASNATLKKARRAVENGGGQLILCPHCGGHGFLDASEAESQVDPRPREDQISGIHPAPQVMSSVPRLGPNEIDPVLKPPPSFESPASAFDHATVPSSAGNMPSIHRSSSRSNYFLPSVPTLPSNGNPYDGRQDTSRIRSQMPQSPGIWSGASNTTGSGPHIGWPLTPSTGKGNQQTVPMPQATLMDPLPRQRSTATGMNAALDSNYWQVDQEVMLNNHQANVPTGQGGISHQVAQQGQIEPMPRPRRVTELLSLGGHNALGAVTHGRPRKRSRTEDQELDSRRESTAPYGYSSMANERMSKRARIAEEQSSMMAIGQDLSTPVELPSGQQVAASDNAYFLSNDYPIAPLDNATSSHSTDYPPLDPAILGPNYSTGSDHGLDQTHEPGVAAPAESLSGFDLPPITGPDFDLSEVDFSQFLKDYADPSTFGFEGQ
ncbi:hypothetical protein K449DRAFT_429479 [Hypoxylon sp. EC38]|nr:hypothetical protein K449DRAFT_429479 [Hypoxylon sp. EC38]